MKQVLQSVRTGEVTVADVPVPVAQRGRVLVRTHSSLISAGTEKFSIDEAKKGLLNRARTRPDLVKKVVSRAKTDGLLNTLAAVREKLDSSTALGYSAAGTVVEIGADVDDFKVGDRVACAGTGYASHAEMISVAQNLCVRLPDEVGFDEGSFGTLGAIALQGVRLADPTLGEAVVVIGLGLLGQLTVQLLIANGCRVFGVDTDETKFALANELGAESCSTPGDTPRHVDDWSRGRGADAVIITAATSSNEPVELGGEVSRVKGRVVVVGLVGMDVPRDIYFRKELSLQISRSYGPGRYDPDYEERGHDYPFAYVRWTEQRNLEAFFDLVANKRINVGRLISHRFAIEDAAEAYKLLSDETKRSYLGVVLQYDSEREIETKIATVRTSAKTGDVRIGMIGAGDYARAMLLPNFKTNGASFSSIATGSGLTAKNVAEQYGFTSCVSAADDVLNDERTNLIVIATRHDTHASLAKAALERDKHVFVEKPLALNDGELDSVVEAATRSSNCLMVGFNRRFSPAASQAREFFAGRRSPLSILYRINAGRIPRDHWTQDGAQGGRIVGEVCHFIDLMHFVTGSLTTRVFAESISARADSIIDNDSVMITLRFADGSNGTIAYLAEGDKALHKERVEIFGGGRTFVIDDFRQTFSYENGKEKRGGSKYQNKGQAEQVSALCSLVRNGGEAPIDLTDLERTTRATFRILDSLSTGQPIDL